MSEFVFPQYVKLPEVEVKDTVSALKEMAEKFEETAKYVAFHKVFDPDHQHGVKLNRVNPEWFVVAANVLRQVIKWMEGQSNPDSSELFVSS